MVETFIVTCARLRSRTIQNAIGNIIRHIKCYVRIANFIMNTNKYQILLPWFWSVSTWWVCWVFWGDWYKRRDSSSSKAGCHRSPGKIHTPVKSNPFQDAQIIWHLNRYQNNQKLVYVAVQMLLLDMHMYYKLLHYVIDIANFSFITINY